MTVKGNKNGNRRTANIRSVGYSDLFVLSKEDLWDALKEYPESKRTFMEKGRQMLRKDNLLDEEIANIQDSIGSTEERVDQVEQAIETVTTRLGRLMAEVVTTMSRLDRRLNTLNSQLVDTCKANSAAAASSSSVASEQVDTQGITE